MNIFDIICLLSVGYFAYEDYKTRYISDNLAIPLIILGLIYLMLTNISYIWVPIIIFIIGFIGYYTGTFGGGDAEVLLIISTFMPYYINILNFKIPFVFFVFFIAVLLSSFVLPIIYLYKIGKKTEIIFSVVITLTIILLTKQIFIALTIFLFIIFIIFMIEKENIQKTFFVKKKKVENLNFEDILCLEYDENLKKFANKKVYLPNEIEDLKKKLLENNIKEVLVYEDLPCFVPFIFVSLVVCYFLFVFIK